MDDLSERSPGSPEDDKGDDGKKQINRACDFCHRMKMKCIGKETPPCNRCRQSGQQCTFDGPRKSKASKVEDRLKFVEEQMSVVQTSLTELISLQRAALHPAIQASRPDEQQAQPSFQTPAETYTTPNTLLSLQSFFEPSLAQQDSSRTFSQPNAPPPPAGPVSHPGPLGHVAQSQSGIFNPARIHAPVASTINPWSVPDHSTLPQGSSERADPIPSSTSNLHTELNSAVQSDDEDDADPLEPSAIIYNNMLYLAEAARLKADGHMVADDETRIDRPGESSDPGIGDKRKLAGNPPHQFDYSVDDDDRRKRPRRLDEPVLKRALPLQQGNHVHAFLDPVDMGICIAEKGLQLFNLFMEGCAVYVPIFDPSYDTWESLRKRSPFCITTLLMVGAKIEDAGGTASELQKKCKDHAEKIGMNTLFTPVARIEALQAMTSWGDTSWRPGGHALRMATDMGLYRCLPYLAQTGMGTGRSPAELQDERPLVVGARCWLALYKSEYEMAFNLGRPALFAGEETIKHCRRFLDHPLALQTDSRLVATCELLTLRTPMHQPFSIWPSATRVPNLDERIQEANESFAQWLQYWEEYYIRLGVPQTSFLRESLKTQYAHAVLHTNSRILHGVRSRRDVPLLSERRRGLLLQALRSAETLVQMSLRSKQYAVNFPKANHYTHVGIAFAARFLIRLTSLVPEAVNLRQTGRDLEQLTKILAKVPGFQFAQQIRDIIIKARRKRVLPPASKAPSPTQTHAALPPEDNWTPTSGPSATLVGAGTNSLSSTSAAPSAGPSSEVFSFDTPPEQGLAPLDFLYAEQLFSTGAANLPDISHTFDSQPGPLASSTLVEPMYNLDSWFPYPPLETDGALGVGSGIGIGHSSTQGAEESPSNMPGGQMFWS